jgi:hypothetical protein
MMMAPNPGYNAGINDPKKYSKVERLAWAWKGAQKKGIQERRLSALQAVTEGRELSGTLSGKVSQAGGQPGDVTVAAVFAAPENLSKLVDVVDVVVFRSLDPQADINDLKAVGEHINAVPIGFVICVVDREKGNFIAHYRPLILQRPALDLLQSVVQEMVSPVSGQLYTNGERASLFYSWEPPQTPEAGWELAAVFYVVPAPVVKGWIVKARATSEKWQGLMSDTLPFFQKRLDDLLPVLNELGLSLTRLKPGLAKALEAALKKMEETEK